VSDDEELVQVLLRQRACAADWLVIHAEQLAGVAERRASSNLLIFACLEARNAIEQLWFEILVVLRSGQVTLEFVERIRHRRDSFLAAIREAEPNYRKLVRFFMLCMQLDSLRPVDIIPWDLGRLKKWWHALSEYCHAQAEPMTTLSNPDWFAKGVCLVREKKWGRVSTFDIGTPPSCEESIAFGKVSLDSLVPHFDFRPPVTKSTTAVRGFKRMECQVLRFDPKSPRDLGNTPLRSGPNSSPTLADLKF
jgi:hypothetical protein